MDQGMLLEAVGQVYASMFDEDAERRWMDLVRDMAGAEHAILSDATGPALVVHASGMDEDMVPLALELSATTLYDLPLERMVLRSAQRMSDFLPIAQLMRTEVYRTLVRPLRGGHALAFPWAHGRRRAAIAVCRDAARGRDFSDAECGGLQPLLGHVRAALDLRLGLSALRGSLGQAHAALDAMDEAVFIVDRGRRVQYMNRRAHGLLAEGGGIRVDRGVLGACRTGDGRGLDALLASALAVAAGPRIPRAGAPASLGAGGARLVVARDAGRSPLLVSAAPATAMVYAQGQPDFADAALVLVRDPDHVPACRLQELQALFALTPREAELAAALREGLCLQQAAMRLGLTEGTARQYLKQIFAKTGVARQAGLVALLRSVG